APYKRDEPTYLRLLERFEDKKPVSPAAHRDAVVQGDVGRLAWRAGETEEARRRFLLAVTLDPFDRVNQLDLARCYAVLEEKALEGAGDRPVGEVLMEKVGIGNADMHIDMAQRLVDERFGPDLASATVSFLFEGGVV